MTHQLQTTAVDPFAELLAEQGFDGLADALRVLLNEVMKLERAAVLKAAPHRRAEGRTGYADGFKPKASLPGSARGPWPSRRPEASSSTPRPWRRASRPNGRSSWRWPRCKSKGCPSAVFNAQDRPEAERQLEIAVRRYRTGAPKLSAWLESSVPEGLTVFALPPSRRRRLRTSNMLKRLNEEIRRRTRVAGLFPSEASALRLVSAVLMEISEDWETNRKYLTMEPA